ncbi:hypothetical protein NGA_0244500, partial [Nannochloropsis gaditana CCMP526]|uniref:uncharacterized protein n=1 Tax=Nannochloropsis gaditana (strain CCMP526) TaxID=1093141 RepID=UPI00029F72BF
MYSNVNDNPATRPRSPMTGDPLRAKDLLPLPLMVDPEWRNEHDGRGKFLCAVSRKAITSQPAVFIK